MLPLRECADGDRTALVATTAPAGRRLARVCSGGQLLRIGEAIAIRIARGAIVRISRAAGAHACRPVVERIESVLSFPAVGQTVAIGVEFERIGLRPLLAGVVGPVAWISVAVDNAIEVFVLAVAIAQSVLVGVFFGRTGFDPSLSSLDFVVWPLPGQPRVPCRVDGLTVAVYPAVAISVFNAVANTVVVRIRIGRIGHRSGSLAGAVIALVQGTDAWHFAIVADHRVERRVEVADEILEAIAVRIRRDVGHVGIGQTPSHLEGVGQKIAVGIRTVRQREPRRTMDVHVAIAPCFSVGFRQIFLVCLVDIDEAVLVVIIARTAVGPGDLAQDDARVAHRLGHLAAERGRGFQHISGRCGDPPGEVPGLGVAGGGNLDAVP